MYDKNKTLEMITFNELAGIGFTLMPYNCKSTRKLPTLQLANKYELTFKCCCNEPSKCKGFLQNCLQDLLIMYSDRGLVSLILKTKTSRNVKRNPRFRRPDFFQDISRYSHIKLITEVTP